MVYSSTTPTYFPQKDTYVSTDTQSLAGLLGEIDGWQTDGALGESDQSPSLLPRCLTAIAKRSQKHSACIKAVFDVSSLWACQQRRPHVSVSFVMFRPFGDRGPNLIAIRNGVLTSGWALTVIDKREAGNHTHIHQCIRRMPNLRCGDCVVFAEIC